MAAGTRINNILNDFEYRVKYLQLLAFFYILFSIFSPFIVKTASNFFIDAALYDIVVPDSSSRVLVAAPHCDDEILAASELIRKTLNNGGQVKVVILTNGDANKSYFIFKKACFSPGAKDYINLGYKRQKESIDALNECGLSEDNIIFLGYPDKGLYDLWNSYWSEGIPYKSRYTNTSKSPYSNSYAKYITYTGENVAKNLLSIIDEYRPTHIVYPHYADTHPDHYSTFNFIRYTLSQTKHKPQWEYLYLIHFEMWPDAIRTSLNMNLIPPASLASKEAKWYKLDVVDDGLNKKIQAINQYKSQLPGLSPTIDCFKARNELFYKYENTEAPEVYKR